MIYDDWVKQGNIASEIISTFKKLIDALFARARKRSVGSNLKEFAHVDQSN